MSNVTCYSLAWSVCTLCFFVSPELMLLGFISLLLTVFQGLISEICISPNLATQMLPCKRPHRSSEGSAHYQIYYDAIINRRRLLSSGSGSDHCTHKVITNVTDNKNWNSVKLEISQNNIFIYKQIIWFIFKSMPFFPKQGKVPLLSLESLHQLHIFIFVLAVVHAIFCVTTMLLAGAKVI